MERRGAARPAAAAAAGGRRHVGIGRDHTLFALETGRVEFKKSFNKAKGSARVSIIPEAVETN